MLALIYFLPFFIMHFLTYVFIPHDEDIESTVATVLKPFNEALDVPPYRIYLSKPEIAAMAKEYHLRPTQRQELSKHLQKWYGSEGGVDSKGLYYWATYNPEGKWDWYEIGGRWDGHLRNNIMSAKTLAPSSRLEKLLPHAFLDSKGHWHECERFGGRPYPYRRLIKTPKHIWRKRFRAALEADPTWDVVVVDIHR